MLVRTLVKVSGEEAKNMFRSCHQTAGQNPNIKAANKSFENVACRVQGGDEKCAQNVGFKRPFARHRRRREDNIKTDLRE
jgi:hypothetical protein